MKPAAVGLARAAFNGTSVTFGAGERHAEVRPVTDGGALVFDIVGKPGDAGKFEARHLLGRRKIEQHLVADVRGRLQAMPIGFDTRKGEWFDIFAGDPRSPEDWGHWRNGGMNANTHCLPCHATDVSRGYDAALDQYDTRWAEAGAGCEACHGPGSGHVAARTAKAAADPYRDGAQAVQGSCAPCHSLRRELTPGFRPGHEFLDFYEPLLLDHEEFHPDGQVRNESFEWNAFRRSAMAGHGVTCTDCHEPHSGQLRAAGNDLCQGCHGTKINPTEHSHHPAGSPGAQCVACHMPTRHFMVRDDRHDHSFPIPDPIATAELGIPNACDSCHEEKPKGWAATKVEAWWGAGDGRAKTRRWAAAIQQGRAGNVDSVRGLLECAHECPDEIRRASSVRLLARFAERPGVMPALEVAARDANPVVRSAAVWAIAQQEGGSANAVLMAASQDPIRLIRMNAAWGLRRLPTPQQLASPVDPPSAAVAEWIAAAATEADHPESHHALGALLADRGDHRRAVDSFRTAVRMMPANLDVRFELAHSLERLGQRSEALEQLAAIRRANVGHAPAAFAEARIYADQQDWEKAISRLKTCIKSEPAFPGALSALTRAYLQINQVEGATAVLTAALDHPDTRAEALRTVIEMYIALDDRNMARTWARVAAAEDPDLAADPRIRALVAESQS